MNSRFSNLLFLTKFLFWGTPFLILCIFLLIIFGDFIYAILLFGFSGMLLYAVEQGRKFYHSDKRKGLNPHHISSVLITAWSINFILMLVYKTGAYSFMFLILSLSTLLFFFKIKKDDEKLNNERRNIQ